MNVLRRWFPRDRTLRQALTGLAICLILSLAAGGLDAWDSAQHGWFEAGRRAVALAVAQYGPESPQAAAAIRQMGETPAPKDVVALLDPATGKALAAWPAELAGKRPEEMALAGGSRLPGLGTLKYREHFTQRRPDAALPGAMAPYATNKLSVRVTGLYPWSGPEEEPGPQRGGQSDGRGAAAPQPSAFLLAAAPPPGVTALGLLSLLCGALAALGFAFYWLSVAWWVFADARRRAAGKALAWGVLALLTNLVGVAVYLVARQEWTECPNCQAGVERAFRHCPHCGQELRPTCSQCGRTLRPGWAYCADCGTPTAPPATG